MSSSFLASLLDVERQPGTPPMLRAEAPGDAPSWAAEHRDAPRTVVADAVRLADCPPTIEVTTR